MFTNPLKQKLLAGQKTAGAWLQIASPFTAEILSQAGFDWLIIDMEHGPGDIMMLISQMQAMQGSEAVPLVRVPWNDAMVVKRVLDAGAYGIIFPAVSTRDDAEAAVFACKYPPEGLRGAAASPRAAGYGQNTGNYLAHANAQLLVIAMIETGAGVENLDEILAVPGIDGVFIGSMDLVLSLGYSADPTHPDVQAAFNTIEEKTLAANKFLGTISGSWEQAHERFKKGYQMITLMADGVTLSKTSRELVSQFRSAFP